MGVGSTMTTATTTENSSRRKRAKPRPLAKWVEAHRLCGMGYEWQFDREREAHVYRCLRCGETYPDDFPPEYLGGGGA